MSSYETNKWDTRDAIAKGGWIVEYGDKEITETDLTTGAVAAGVSIYAANPALFTAWVTTLVKEVLLGIEKAATRLAIRITEDIRRDMIHWAQDKFLDLLKAKKSGEDSRSFDRLDCKVGIAHYTGHNRLWIPDPVDAVVTYIGSGETGDAGHWEDLTATQSYQPYLAVRVHKPPEPPTAEDLPAFFSATVWCGDERIYFFHGDKYFRYNIKKHYFDKDAKIGHPGFEGLWTNGIDAAVRGVGDREGYIYFFRGGEYIRWKIGGNISEVRVIGKDGWKGLWSDGIDAAVNHPNGKIYFFKGKKYLRWESGTGVDREGEVGVDGWAGLWTNGFDAATDHPNGRLYFFKGHEYRRWEPGVGVDKKGKIDVDGWHTC